MTGQKKVCDDRDLSAPKSSRESLYRSILHGDGPHNGDNPLLIWEYGCADSRKRDFRSGWRSVCSPHNCKCGWRTLYTKGDKPLSAGPMRQSYRNLCSDSSPYNLAKVQFLHTFAKYKKSKKHYRK